MVSSKPIETITVRANGLQFEVDTCGSGDRLALCLHGFPESAFSWRLQLPLLADLGYRVWAPNQRGYGRTSRPRDVDDYRISELLADVAALVDAAQASSVTLIGHDWGAVLAWVFAADQVRPLERLVIMNVPHPAIFARELRTPRQLLRSWYIAFFQLPVLPEALLTWNDGALIRLAFRAAGAGRAQFPDAVLDVYRRNALQPGALTAMINWYRALGRHAVEFMQRSYAIIDVPTLMLWGEADVALGKATTIGTQHYVRDLTLRYLPGVSHWTQQDAPRIVNAMLTAFLRGEPVPESGAL